MRTLFAKRWFRALLALVAFLGAVALGYYQRRTGPSWPVRVREAYAGTSVEGRLPRSHPGEGGAVISLEAPSDQVTGEVLWRRYPTGDPWQRLAMERSGETLSAELPHQPPAGKLEYSLRLRGGEAPLALPAGEALVIRYRGDVPAWVLLPHIILMFAALIVVLRAALGALLGERSLGRFVPWVLLLMVPGGLVLGPVVQKLAFGAFWTGWPFGEDWTDNKTLAAVVVWILAGLVCRRWPRLDRGAILLASAVMLSVYLIPHSTHGSELDWSQVEQGVEKTRPQPAIGNTSSIQVVN